MRQFGQDIRGFTLMELVVVLLIISLTTAIAAPSLRGFSDGAKVRNATDDVIAATRYARSQAILSAAECVLTINVNSATVSLSSRVGDSVAAVNGEWGNGVAMPEGMTIELAEGGESTSSVVFYPDGRCTPAVFRLRSPRGEEVLIQSASPAEPFKVVGSVP